MWALRCLLLKREDVELLPAKEMLTESRAYTRSTLSGRDPLASGGCLGETSANVPFLYHTIVPPCVHMFAHCPRRVSGHGLPARN